MRLALTKRQDYPMTDCLIRVLEETLVSDVVAAAGNVLPCPAPHHRAAVSG
jgi:hypothetical protein